MSWLSKARRKFTKAIYKAAGSKIGSIATGRFIVERKIQERDLQAGGGKLIDIFGSPATAGTKQQTTARTGAVIYGAVVGAGALAAKAAASSAAASTAASSGASAGVVAGGGGSVAGTVSGTFLSTATKALTAGLLARGIGLLNPKVEDALPQENYYPNGLGGEIYPGFGAPYFPGSEEFGGSPISYSPEGLPISGEGSSSVFSVLTTPIGILAIAAIVTAFIVFRR